MHLCLQSIINCFILRAVKLGEYVNKPLNKRSFKQLWLLQFSLTMILAVVCAILYGLNAAFSVLLGGLVCIIPNAIFAVNLFKHAGARSARQIVKGFYQGEALKILVSIVLFTAIFIFCRITPLAFFGAYIVILMMHWFSPLLIKNK